MISKRRSRKVHPTLRKIRWHRKFAEKIVASSQKENLDSDGLIGLPELPAELRSIIKRVLDSWLGFRSEPPGPAGDFKLQFHRRELQRTLSVAFVIFLMIAGIGIAWEKLDPFGLNESVSTYSATVFSRIAAPFYQSDAQNKIAVVLIDESTLEYRRTAWPPRYTYYEEVIRRVLRHNPRAIYVDVLLEEMRAYDSSLPDAKDALKADLEHKPVRVLFGLSEPGKRNMFDDVPRVGTAIAGWDHTNGGYPLTVSEEYARTRDVSNSKQRTRNADERRDSVALALYDLACDGVQTGCAESAQALDASSRSRLMSVQWGAAVPKESAEYTFKEAAACTLVAPTNAQRRSAAVSATWGSLIYGIFPDLVNQSRVACPYTLTLREQDLGDARIQNLLQDRIVLIGTNLVGLDDSVPSPVHGKIAGVYLHAMALDNLMTWGHRHFQRKPSTAWIVPLILSILLATTVAFLLRWKPTGMLWYIWITSFLIIATMMWVMHVRWHRPPLDWIGMLGLLFVATEIEKWARRRTNVLACEEQNDRDHNRM